MGRCPLCPRGPRPRGSLDFCSSCHLSGLDVLEDLVEEHRLEIVAGARGLARGKERREAVLGEGDLLDAVKGGDDAVDDREAAVVVSTGECRPRPFTK